MATFRCGLTHCDFQNCWRPMSCAQSHDLRGGGGGVMHSESLPSKTGGGGGGGGGDGGGRTQGRGASDSFIALMYFAAVGTLFRCFIEDTCVSVAHLSHKTHLCIPHSKSHSYIRASPHEAGIGGTDREIPSLAACCLICEGSKFEAAA